MKNNLKKIAPSIGLCITSITYRNLNLSNLISREMVTVLQRNISGCHVFLENHTNEFAIKSFLDPFEIPIHLYADKNSFLEVPIPTPHN